jgi:hypothetical protein
MLPIQFVFMLLMLFNFLFIQRVDDNRIQNDNQAEQMILAQTEIRLKVSVGVVTGNGVSDLLCKAKEA